MAKPIKEAREEVGGFLGDRPARELAPEGGGDRGQVFAKSGQLAEDLTQVIEAGGAAQRGWQRGQGGLAASRSHGDRRLDDTGATSAYTHASRLATPLSSSPSTVPPFIRACRPRTLGDAQAGDTGRRQHGCHGSV